MTQLPEPPGAARPPQATLPTPARPSHRLLPPRRLLLALGLATVVGGGVVVWQRSDQILGRIYTHWRPRLEVVVGRVMGRPLRLGPFQGLGPDGVRIGPSRFLPGPKDGSSAAVDGLVARIDPLASWRDRSLHLTLDLRGAEVDLRRQGKGSIWTFGAVAPGGQPPRLALAVRLLDPARVRLWNLGADPRPLRVDLLGQATVTTHAQAVTWRARASELGSKGVARVLGGGNWAQQAWHTEVQANRWGVAPLIQLLPLRGQVAGEGSGRLALRWQRGRPDCRGRLVGVGMRWRLNASAPLLELPRAPLRCVGTTFVLERSPWRLGPWGGRVGGSLAGRRLRLEATAQPPPSLRLGATPLDGWMEGELGGGGLREARFSAARGRSRLALAGTLANTLTLAGRWRLAPADLPGGATLPPWLTEQPFSGSLRIGGRLAAPRLAVVTGQARHPLLGPWRAELAWSDGLLVLRDFQTPHLRASATLPLAPRPGRGLTAGDLDARFDLSPYPLERLQPLVGTTLGGWLEARGVVRGPLRRLRPDLALRLRNPAAGPLRLDETWRGWLRAELDPARPLGGQVGGGQLIMESDALAPAGRLVASLDRRWMPERVSLERERGLLVLEGSPGGFRWRARQLPLQGIALAFGRRVEHVQGLLGGEGTLALQPLAFAGDVRLSRPRLFGLPGRGLRARVAYADRAYRLRGLVEPLGAGSIDVSLEGRWQGPFRGQFQARQLDAQLFRDVLAARSRGGAAAPRSWGRADDLGTLVFDTLGESLEDQLLALQRAMEVTERRFQSLTRPQTMAALLASLQTSVDADLTVRGRDWRDTRIDLSGGGHLWVGLPDRDMALTSTPFTLRLEGPVWGGEGSFALGGLPLGLLALLTPVPETLRGQLSVNGRYRLGAEPKLALDLALADGAIGPAPLALERGGLTLEKGGLKVDLAARGGVATNLVTLAGRLPLNPESPGLELRLSSRGDGLRVLTRLAGDAVVWKRGSTDLQLLVRGSVRDPIANGFIRLRGGEYALLGQTLSDVEATVLFDFEQVLVQELRARTGARGRLQAEGRIGLRRQLSAEPTLALEIKEAPFAVSRLAARSDGRLTIGGSLTAPLIGGELTISRGKINAQPGQFSPSPSPSPSTSTRAPANPSTLAQLLEQKWDFKQPLVLLGPQIESVDTPKLEDALPRLPWLRFENLRLRFGPGLRVVLPNEASFDTGGSLRINGPLDPSLRASGVVRLLSGRLNLFTTSFSLDPDAPNVAIFTPALGLMPYLDIALRTRIADNIGLVAPNGLGEAQGAGSLATGLTAGAPESGFSSLRQLNLILVTMSVSGPADRIANSLRLSSNPPLPQERLVALIGGNTLAGLSQAGAGTALATVVGQSLLSPLLSSLSDTFGQRVSLALYPTYVNPEISSAEVRRSRRVPPQLVLGAEVGFDLTDRLNVSALAAPNRSDVAPQFTLNYKASEALNVETFIDTLGSWGTQLRLLFRF
ncbi:MAG: translocation/assembly module TamB domain-containing protein [Cyanobacteriota bacterium]